MMTETEATQFLESLLLYETGNVYAWIRSDRPVVLDDKV